MSDMLDTSIEETRPVTRPVFITVLCILSFVGCGFYFLSTLFSIWSVNMQREAFQSLSGNPLFPSGSVNEMENFWNWTIWGNYATLLNVVLCLTGAILMFRLKKAGFFIYSFGQLLLFVPLAGYFLMSQHSAFFVGFGIAATVVNLLIAAAFVIMYGVNLKYMRN